MALLILISLLASSKLLYVSGVHKRNTCSPFPDHALLPGVSSLLLWHSLLIMNGILATTVSIVVILLLIVAVVVLIVGVSSSSGRALLLVPGTILLLFNQDGRAVFRDELHLLLVARVSVTTKTTKHIAAKKRFLPSLLGVLNLLK